MSKLIQVKHPYQVNNLKNLNDYLMTIKYLTNLLQKEGFVEKKDGILIPVRWSIKNNSFVVDRGTDLTRDIYGIDEKNIDYYKIPIELKIGIRYVLNAVNNNDFFKLAETFGLIKNEQRFIAFEFVNGLTNKIDNKIISCYPIGLFIRGNSDIREGVYTKTGNAQLIDNSNNFCESIYNTNRDKFSLNKIKKTDKINIFENFISDINKYSIDIEIAGTKYSINLKSFLQDSLLKNFNKKKISLHNKKYSNFSVELYSKIKNNQINEFINFNEYKTSFVCLYINELYGDYLKALLFNNNIEGLVIQDKKNNLLYKFTGSFNLIESKINKENVVKEEKLNYNNFSFIPRTFWLKKKKTCEESIQELANEIAEVYKGSDWLVVKKYILKYLTPAYKKNFSTRDYISKKHTLNSFELDLIDKYYKSYGIRLELDESKTHKPKIKKTDNQQ